MHLTTVSHACRRLGTGKSTLLKLMVGNLEPLDGMVKRHNHLRIGMYHQHLTELLDPDVSALGLFICSYTQPPSFCAISSLSGAFWCRALQWCAALTRAWRRVSLACTITTGSTGTHAALVNATTAGFPAGVHDARVQGQE